MGKKRTVEKETENVYPSAEMLQQVCQDDYFRLIDTYDKVYEKINVTLAFCGVVFLVILGSLDYTSILKICNAQSNLELFSLLIFLICSVVSSFCIIWAVVQLLSLMRSKEIPVFDSIDIRNEEIYRWSNGNAAVWLIDKYTIVTSALRTIISNKQKKYDSAVTKVVIALVMHAVVLVIEKGM